MSRLTSTFTLWPSASRNSSGASPTSIPIASFREGLLFTHLSVASGAFVPVWQTTDGAGHWTVHTRGVTCTATGLSLTPLTNLGAEGRPAWEASGAGAKFTVSFTAILKE